MADDTTLTLTILLVLICAGVVAIFSIILVAVFIIAESNARKKSGLDLKNHTANTKSYVTTSKTSSPSTSNRNIKDVESGIDSFPKISDPSLAEDILAKFVKPDKSPATTKAKVLYDFTAQQPGDLTIRVGEIITILKTNDSGWWVGQNDTLESGTFPYNYVETIKE